MRVRIRSRVRILVIYHSKSGQNRQADEDIEDPKFLCLSRIKTF